MFFWLYFAVLVAWTAAFYHVQPLCFKLIQINNQKPKILYQILFFFLSVDWIYSALLFFSNGIRQTERNSGIFRLIGIQNGI